MTKSNARQLLASTLKQFHKEAGESVGVAFTWKGNLSVLGTESFRAHILQHKQDIWRKLSFTPDKLMSKPAHNVEYLSILEGEVTTYV